MTSDGVTREFSIDCDVLVGIRIVFTVKWDIICTKTSSLHYTYDRH